MFILGGQLTLNLERICRDLGRIASDNVHPGGGGQSTLNLERIHRDFGRIASDNVDPGGLINTQLGKDQCRDLGRIASDNVDPGGIDTQLWKGQLGRDQLGKEGGETLNLERIHRGLEGL